MAIPCFHCDDALPIKLDDGGALHRCVGCRKLNVILTERAPLNFADYSLLEMVGLGANATVCRARKRSTGDIVAVKIFYAHRDISSHSRREFLRELEFARELVHPNIIATHNGGEHDDVLFLELEFFHGINLIEYLEQQGAMPQFAALNVGIKVAAALDYVWSNHLSIHRDIKPQNVMVNNAGDVKVCDFGMITNHEAAGVDVSAVEGTPYYLSPECITEGAYADNRSDIYSLGASLYHTMAEKPPFDLDSLLSVINARLENEAPDIRIDAPDIDSHISRILQTMMARDPNQRYVTAWECAEDMQRVCNQQEPQLYNPDRDRRNE
ncbi:MAG: serine/threonine protein kinase [Rhodothermales bacterium]|jgi:serine/threonine protein kinase